METTQSLTIFEPENVRTLAELAPRSYQENQLSHVRCLEAGSALLLKVQKEGMNDALDVEIARFIEKAKLTVRKMYGKRTPVTQLFDRIRKVYTAMESDVDPSKPDSIPGQLQAARNAFARRKHEEEERRRRQEAAKVAHDNALDRYRSDVEEDYLRQFNALISNSINTLYAIDRGITLDNIEEAENSIRTFSDNLPTGWASSSAQLPVELTPDECRAIRADVISKLSDRIREQYRYEITTARDEILDRLPSKKRELERIAKANAEEAARLKADLEAKEREEAARKEAARREAQKQQEAEKRLEAQKKEMDGLFGDASATPTTYQPKTQVKKKVVIESPEDIMKVVAFWWSQEGSRKSLEELQKEFCKQINFANSAANSKSNPTFISDIRYEDEVKAK